MQKRPTKKPSKYVVEFIQKTMETLLTYKKQFQRHLDIKVTQTKCNKYSKTFISKYLLKVQRQDIKKNINPDIKIFERKIKLRSYFELKNQNIIASRTIFPEENCPLENYPLTLKFPSKIIALTQANSRQRVLRVN